MIPGSANPLLLATAAGAAGGYEIERSLRFNSSDSAYLSRTPASAGNRKTWTWAGWVKKSSPSGSNLIIHSAYSDSNNRDVFQFLSTSSLQFVVLSGGSVAVNLNTSAVFRDASAWYHVILAVDTTQATSSDRVKIYFNGSQITSFAASTYPSQNADLMTNNNVSTYVGREVATGLYTDLYFADIHLIDGQALDPSSFGEFDTNGVWQPIDYAGTFGTNGFHLPFSDNSTAAALGTDTSGNGNTWTVNNISVTAGAGNDSLVDSPTNGSQTDTGVGGEVVGNYCTWNPLQKNANVTLSNGNLDYSTTGGVPTAAVGTVAVSSGKWYYETVCTVSPFTPPVYYAGVVNIGTFVLPSSGYLDVTGVYAYSLREGGTINNGSFSASGWSTAAVNDVIGVALDLDAGTVKFYKNNSLLGTISGLSGSFAPFIAADTNSSPTSSFTNFGQRPFTYTAPSGFKALNTASLPAPVVTKPSEYMDVALYTGNSTGSQSQTISGLGFSPDLLWIKSRSTVHDNFIFDAIRGPAKYFRSNSTDGDSGADTSYLNSFNSDGFTVGYRDNTNEISHTFVAWTWDAGSSTVTNTQGSISSQVRANPGAGFSVVTWGTGSNTGSQSIGHGLNVSPQFVITKVIDAADSWLTWHHKLGTNEALFLNNTNAAASNAAYAITPSSTTITVANVSNWWIANKNYLFYCFAPVAGYSSFGSYTGNGSADGPFVFCNFRPRWVLFKNTNSGENWRIMDAARNTYNVANSILYPNLSNAEGSSAVGFDILSNGFKIRESGSELNASGATIVYAAFAESPFQYARAR
jgi:hypothetical protein